MPSFPSPPCAAVAFVEFTEANWFLHQRNRKSTSVKRDVVKQRASLERTKDRVTFDVQCPFTSNRKWHSTKIDTICGECRLLFLDSANYLSNFEPSGKCKLLQQMRVFTLDASNIKGIARKFACSRPVWSGPETKHEGCAQVASDANSMFSSNHQTSGVVF